MNLVETDLGFEIHTPRAFLFFGKKKANFENLRARYTQFEWARVRQTHSDIAVPSPNPQHEAITEADAHWTSRTGMGVLISTADCVPILIVDPVDGRAASVHAGWRGVQNRILPNTIAALEAAGSPWEQLWFFIGPHIQKPSFEVDADVKDLLMASSPLNDETITESKGSKHLVDLNGIIKNQIAEADVSPDRVFGLHLDTFTDARLHSHRRDRENAGRQLSFALLS